MPALEARGCPPAPEPSHARSAPREAARGQGWMPQSPGGAGPAHTLVSGQPHSMWPRTWWWFAPAAAGLKHKWGLVLTAFTP